MAGDERKIILGFNPSSENLQACRKARWSYLKNYMDSIAANHLSKIWAKTISTKLAARAERIYIKPS